MNKVDKRLLKYIPKKMQPYVVWLDYEKSSHVYFLTFEKDGREVSAEPSDSVSELTWNARQCRDELFNSVCNVDEAYAQSPQMMTVRNQLMNKLGDDFSAIGGSMNPKIIVKYEVDPKIDFEITPNGKNLDVVGRIDKIPDTVHKKKGIAYMRAGNIIYDYIMDFIEDNESEKNEGFKLRIKE